MNTADLCRALDYQFRDSALLQEALTHRSAAGISNERLEFLGDAVLDFVIGAVLFKRYPQASEGELSRLRASLVKGETLAELARGLSLGDYLRLGGGELKTGGAYRTSILADALEAIFGAVYLDGGFEDCRCLILRLYQKRLQGLPPVAELKDPKTRLQERQQARQQELPCYNVLEISGQAHAQHFTIECAVAGVRTVAMASSRRKAEQQAARQALELLT